jgi:DNA polymerase (family X)
MTGGAAGATGSAEPSLASLPVQNAEIAAVFNEIAELLDIEGANPFRVRAYRRAARTIGSSDPSVQAMLAGGFDPDALPGIGPDLAAKIKEIVDTGQCGLLKRLRGELPGGITALLKVPGLGPHRVRALHRELDISTLDQLRRAARDGKVRTVPGFGPKTEQAILDATLSHGQTQRRVLIGAAA